ncbi:MAG: hypothetical protein M3122_01115 [Actinomycetota bacterium]|nr:hypothetical protein [Actinomycetota bacterium]
MEVQEDGRVKHWRYVPELGHHLQVTEASARRLKRGAYARIWMALADDNSFPAVFVASVGRERSSGRLRAWRR